MRVLTLDAQELFHNWTNVRSGLLEALDKLTDAQFDFTPRDGLWSLRETVVHIADTEDGWLRHYSANRWHETSFQVADYPTLASLKALLAEQHAITEAQFADNPDALLAQVRPLPWGKQVTMSWVVWHVVEHEIHHRGEVYLILGLMGIEAPDV